MILSQSAILAQQPIQLLLLKLQSQILIAGWLQRQLQRQHPLIRMLRLLRTAPLFLPNDPATLNGGRAATGDLYIGPTNFAEIQRSTRHTQIERATQRDANRNISWRQGVDINSIPRSGAGTSMTPPTGRNTCSNGRYVRLRPIDNISCFQPVMSQTYQCRCQRIQNSTLTGIDLALDNITKQQQAITERESYSWSR